MTSVFADYAGHVKDSKERVVVLATLIASDPQIEQINRRCSDLKNTVAEWGIDTSHEQFEFKTYEMLQGSGIWRTLGEDKRIKVAKRLIEIHLGDRRLGAATEPQRLSSGHLCREARISGNKTMNCHLSYRGSIARIAILLDMPDYRCAELALAHGSECMRPLVMASLFHLDIETRSTCRSTEITRGLSRAAASPLT